MEHFLKEHLRREGLSSVALRIPKNHMKSFVEEVADVDGGPPKAIDTTSSLEINGGDS